MNLAVCLRKLKQGLWINLKSWNGEGDETEVQKGGDICIPMTNSYWSLTEKKKNSMKRLSHKNKLIEKKIINITILVSTHYLLPRSVLRCMYSTLPKSNKYWPPHSQGFPGGSKVKNLLANAGDVGLIPGLGRSPEKKMATLSSILAWEIPWTRGAWRPQSTGSQNLTWLIDWHFHFTQSFYFYTEKTKTWMTETSLQTI